MASALVVFSGGQDSTTCLYWAKKTFAEVRAIGFHYGQKHAVELEQARRIAEIAQVPFHIVDLRGALSGSSLVDHSQSASGAHPQAPELPSTFTPGRNAVFLSLAAGHAFNYGIQDLVTGVCETDYSGYPDCRADFIAAMALAMSRALDREVRIHTPLMYLTKAETWKLAKELGCLEIVIEHSHTDYNGDRSVRNEWGYGKLDNPASELRAKGFEEAKRKGWI